jgi:hypothetical protein
VSTIGTRLNKHGAIEQTTIGWMLRDVETALRDVAGRVWGPKEKFADQEVCAHRLEGIESIYAAKKKLSPAELAAILKSTPWIEPSAQHMVYGDLKKLARKGVLQRGFKKAGDWKYIEPKGQAKLRLA